MTTLEVTTPSPAATRGLGTRAAAVIPPGSALLLDGELGAGKTTFVQGLAAGLGVAEPIRSPTFALLRDLGPLVHVDLYRLDAVGAASLGLEDYLDGRRIIAVEWGNHLPAGFWGEKTLTLDVVFSIVGARRRRLALTFDEPVPAAVARRLGEVWRV
jgi:tRNA threonylcarbamoyladenosine biosynthesis protein TsaE